MPRPNCNPFLVAVALAMVIVAGCGKQPANPKASTGPAPIPVWTSDPTLTDQLGDEQKVGTYSIRPPKGYKKTFTPGRRRELSIALGKDRRGVTELLRY